MKDPRTIGSKMKDPRTINNTSTKSAINPVVSTLKNASVIQTANDVKKPTLTYEQAQQIAKENNIKMPNKLTLPNFKSNIVKPSDKIEEFRKDHAGLTQEEYEKALDSYDKGNWGANYTLGNMQIKYNDAMSKYFKSQDEKDLAEAEELRKQIDRYQKYANNVNEGNWITKDFAAYVPQLLGQTGAGITGATAGAATGAATGAAIGSAVPGAGTVAGAGTGAIWGAKAGYVGGVAKFSYDQMRGSAYADLLDLGVPNDIALEVANDTALWQGIIEGAGAGVDLATLGIGKLFSKGAKTAGQLTAKKLITNALKSYGINLASETAEEAIQEKVAIEGEKKAFEKAGMERTTTADEDTQRIIEAGAGGFKIALISGSGNVIGNVTTSTINASTINQTNKFYNDYVQQVQNSNLTEQQKQEMIADAEQGREKTLNAISQKISNEENQTPPQNNTNLEETSPNTVQLDENNVQNALDFEKTVQNVPQIQEETVGTNIGNIPIAEYRDIMAQQAGFNDYADMRRQGYKLGNKYDVEVQEVQEAQVDRRPTLDLRKIAQNYIEEGNISEQDKQILRETIDSATDAEIDGDLLHGLRNTIKEQEEKNTMYKEERQTEYHVSKNISKDIDNVLNNINERNPVKLRDYTPSILVQNGIKDLPMYENPSHIRNNILTETEARDLGLRVSSKDHYHGLGKDTYIKAIESLDDPRVVLKYKNVPNQYIILTVVKDNQGNNIIVPIEVETDTYVNKIKVDINRIKSVYGYDRTNPDLNKYIKDSIKNNNLEKIYEKKKPSTSKTSQSASVNNIIPNSQNYVNNNLPTQAEQQQAQQELRNKLPTEEQQNQEQEEKIAEILDDTSAQKTNYKELAKDAVTTFRRLFVDSGADIAEIGKIANDETLYHMYNSAKQAGQSANHMISEAQTNWQGEKVGKSLVDIFEPIRQKGQDYYKEFEYYMYHLHNIDRMNLNGKALDELRLFEMEHPEFTTLSQEELEKIAKQEIKEKSEIQVANEYLRLINKYEKATDKPVFGESITSEKSQNIAKQFESKYPEFKEYANDIRTWNANLQQYRIDTGLISQEQADLMNEMYPNYVPTYRDINGISGATKNGNTVRIVNTIKKATGSNKDILPLHEQMARQVMQTVQAGRRNLLGMQLYNDVIKNSDKLGKYVQEIKTTKEDIDTDAEFEFEKPDLEGKFVIFDDGEKIEMQVSNGVLDGLKALTSAKWENNVWSKGARKVNSIFKKLVTEWNPFFIFKNASRDIQDAGFYSEKAKEFYKNYPQAWKEITSDGEIWKKYLAMGGSDASLFDFEQGYVIPKDGIPANVMQKIKEANFLVEQAPRFAEFLRIYNESDKSYESLIKAMYGAADITVNFGRSGTWGKFINNNLVPFFNPAVQGTSKTLRTITGDGKVKGAKNYAKHMANIVGKGVLLGVTPTMINHILLSVFGGDDYDDLNERDKDMYYLIPIGDGKYFKVAKGRVLSVIGGFARRGFEYAMGDKDVFEGFGKFALEQTAPSNPFENNLYSPIQAVKNNTTWYGTPIENESLQNLRPSQRYDEGTTEFAKGLGKTFNVSPKKIDYVLDAYGGVAADVLMPLNTKKAETSGFGKSFILDSTYSNKLSTDFYDTIEELTFDKNDDDPVAKMQLKYMNDVKEKAQDINKQIKDLQASDVKNKEKLKQVRELRKEVNTLQRDALATYEKYGETANKYLNDKSITELALRGTKEDSTEETKQQNIEKTVKLYTDKELFGAEYALQEYDKRLVEKQKESKLDADTFFKIYFAQKGIAGDKNKITGKTQEGSEKKKKIEAMHKAVPKLTPWELNKIYELLN